LASNILGSYSETFGSSYSGSGTNTEVPGHDGEYGFGGKCFPKDLRALTFLAEEIGAPSDLLREIWRTNLDVREDRDWEKIEGATSENLHKK